MHTKIFESINDIEPDAWNSIVERNRLICRHEYLRAIELSKINNCKYFYPVIYDGNRIVAHACFYYIRTELDAFAGGLLKRTIDRVRKRWNGFLVLESIECGTPVALGNTISLARDTDERAGVKLIAESVESMSRKLGVGITLFRDFYEKESSLFSAVLCGMGYMEIHNLPNTQMHVKWSDFNGYSKSMRSGYRRKVKKRMEACSKANVQFEVVNSFAPYADDLARLWRNSYDHAREYRREILLSDFFENLDRELGSRSSVLLARLDDRIVGFSLLLHDDETLIWLFCGLDYDTNDSVPVYFNMIYKIIDYAISSGFKDVDLGITTMLPKQDAGGISVPLKMYMKHANPVLNRIVPWAFAKMTPGQLPGQRKVFK